jgi:hypothetical protein
MCDHLRRVYVCVQAPFILGYRQSLDFLRVLREHPGLLHEDRAFDEFSHVFAVFMDKFTAATRKYVRRQISWFRKNPLFHWEQLRVSESAHGGLGPRCVFEEYCPPLAQAEYDRVVNSLHALHATPETEYAALRLSGDYAQQQQGVVQRTDGERLRNRTHIARPFVFNSAAQLKSLRRRLAADLKIR